jgi:erythromycin esterase
MLCFLMLSCAKGLKPDDVGNIPSHSLQTDQDLDRLLSRIGDARIVMLGEASHGTAEYYQWRDRISRRLIQEKGFTMIAVEGEWADSYQMNQFIKGGPKDSIQAVAQLRQYDRWPTWMWGNYEVASLMTWLNRHNQSQSRKVGFYGMDVYCLWESIEELVPYLAGNDSLLQLAQEVNTCFRPFSADPMQYAYAVANAGANCRLQTERLWQGIMVLTGGRTARDEASFVMQQNALVALNAERYYRTSVSSYEESWNIRDRHMMETINRLMEFGGSEAKLIVWAHNTHIGDARQTDMAGAGMINIGQLARETYGPGQVFLVGFGSHSGNVIASPQWGGPVQNMRVPAAQRDSWEELLHRNKRGNQLLFSDELRGLPALERPIGHRAIGVQYDPGNERGNYVPSRIPLRYDAFLFFDRTTALRPIGTAARNEPPDTYPSGY